MPKLTYWVAGCRNDSDAYSIRGKTKKAVAAALASGGYRPANYAAPKKVTVEYADAFELASMCLSEGRGYWEHAEEKAK